MVEAIWDGKADAHIRFSVFIVLYFHLYGEKKRIENKRKEKKRKEKKTWR
jgi:hypothetical protein